MKYNILQGFAFSRDGIKVERAEKGEIASLPDSVVKGLLDAGYISEGGGMKAVHAPENKAVTPTTPVEKSDINKLRDEYQQKIGKRAYHGWDATELMKRMAE